MRRGDLVTVAAAGDYGKPRPAVIVQTDAFPESHASVVVCQLTSELADAPDFRVTIDPRPENGLRLTSQVMADRPVTIRRERIEPKIGRLSNQAMGRLSAGDRAQRPCHWKARASRWGLLRVGPLSSYVRRVDRQCVILRPVSRPFD